MVSYILLMLLNISFIYILNKHEEIDNDYTKEKNLFYKLKYTIILRIINIFSITYNIILNIILHLDNIISKIDIALFLMAIASYIIFELSIKQKTKRFKLIDKKIINNIDILTISSLFVVIVSGRITDNSDINIFLYLINFLIIVLSITILIKEIIKNKENTCITAKIEEYLKDIKFTSKIELNKIFNYVIYIFAFVMFVFIRIPYIFVIYILVGILIIIAIIKKIKKIENQSDKLYKSITIANEFPGVIYAFQFTRDILLLKKLAYLLFGYTISIICLYGLGESALAFISIEFYILLLYILLNDKIYLIRYIKSLNDKYINKKIYTIDEIKDISYIDKIKIFNITLYRLIIKDNIVIESNIILYDPELIINQIEVRINKSNIDDYITIENILYEE